LTLEPQALQQVRQVPLFVHHLKHLQPGPEAVQLLEDLVVQQALLAGHLHFEQPTQPALLTVKLQGLQLRLLQVVIESQLPVGWVVVPQVPVQL